MNEPFFDTRFPVQRLGHSDDPVDCLIVTSGSESVLSVTASRFQVEQTDPSKGEAAGVAATERWIVDATVPLTADFHGASVVSRTDGSVIGLLLVDDAGSYVSIIPSRLALK